MCECYGYVQDAVESIKERKNEYVGCGVCVEKEVVEIILLRHVMALC